MSSPPWGEHPVEEAHVALVDARSPRERSPRDWSLSPDLDLPQLLSALSTIRAPTPEPITFDDLIRFSPDPPGHGTSAPLVNVPSPKSSTLSAPHDLPPSPSTSFRQDVDFTLPAVTATDPLAAPSHEQFAPLADDLALAVFGSTDTSQQLHFAAPAHDLSSPHVMSAVDHPVHVPSPADGKLFYYTAAFGID